MAHLLVEPKVFREESRLTERLLRRQTIQVTDETLHMFIDGRILEIGTDRLFGMTPQMVHRIQVRAALWQPNQFNVQLRGQLLGRLRCMAGVAVQKQDHRSPSIVPMYLAQKSLEVHPALINASHSKTMASANVDGSKENPTCIAPANEHRRWLAFKRPSCPQYRKEKQVGFIFGQHRGMRWQGLDLKQNSPFFSPGPGPLLTHTESASRHTSTHVTVGEWSLRRPSDQTPASKCLAATGPSSPWPNIYTFEATASRLSAGAPVAPRSKQGGAPVCDDPQGQQPDGGADTDPSNDTGFCVPHEAVCSHRILTIPGPGRAKPRCVDKDPRLGQISVEREVDGAAVTLNSNRFCSWHPPLTQDYQSRKQTSKQTVPFILRTRLDYLAVKYIISCQSLSIAGLQNGVTRATIKAIAPNLINSHVNKSLGKTAPIGESA